MNFRAEITYVISRNQDNQYISQIKEIDKKLLYMLNQFYSTLNITDTAYNILLQKIQDLKNKFDLWTK